MNQPIRIRKSPFHHFISGVKNIFTVNASTAVLMSLIAGLLSAIIGTVFLFTAMNAFLVAMAEPSVSTLIKIAVIGLIFSVIASLLCSFVQLALNRIMVASQEQKTESVSSVLAFARQRFGLAFKTYLTIFGYILAILIGFMVAILLLTLISDILAGLVGVIGYLILILISIAYFFRLLYVQYVLADDTNITTPKAVIQRSRLVWKSSIAPTLLYFLLLLVGAIVIMILTKQEPQATSRTTLQSDEVNNALLNGVTFSSLIVSNTITTLLGIVASSGIVHIYSRAKAKLQASGGIAGPIKSSTSSTKPIGAMAIKGSLRHQ